MQSIKTLRIQNNISQVDMANFAGMSRGAYIAFEKDEKPENLTLKAAVGIARALRVSFSELFEIDFGFKETDEKNEQIEKLSLRIIDLEKRLLEKENMIVLLQKENREYYRKNVALELKEDFDLIWETSSHISGTGNLEAKEKSRNMQVLNFEVVAWKIEKIFESKLLSRYEVLEILYENDINVSHLLETSINYINDLHSYYNNFIKISKEELSQFVTKFHSSPSLIGTKKPKID